MDNVSSRYVKSIFEELNGYGTVSIRRIYGNWERTSGWKKEILLEYSIQPIQQFEYTKGKNAVDMAIVIDAMDVLHTQKTDIFCIVSSDSDFTRLAMRLREANMFVIGMGESKTPTALTKACNKFIHLDLIASEEMNLGESKAEHVQNITQGSSNGAKSNVTAIHQIQEAIVNMVNESECIGLGEIGSRLGKLFSEFDVRNYGYSKLSVFVREELDKVHIVENEGAYYVSMKNDIDIQALSTEIIQMIKSSGGTVQNLSIIHDKLKGKYKNFNLSDYGYSRISSFLRSIEGLTVDGNIVKLRKR